MLIRVPRDASELLGSCATEWGFAQTFARYRGERLRLEPYQERFLRERSKYRCVVKGRQVGYSFLFALEALVRCHLRRNHTAILISYNLQEAVEKITLARELYEELAGPFKKRLVVDSKTELVFESIGAGRRGRSRIVSVPSRAPRGKHGTVYLDELAHYKDARGVYAGTTATILRSGGQLTAASTPLGRRGLFWELAAASDGRYRNYWRQQVPWWLSRFFCRDVARAAIEAPRMTTEERLARFATRALREQLENLPDLDLFQQEFELSFLALRAAYFPYELVLGCMSDDVALVDDISDLGRPEGRLVAGFDVGRLRDRSELALFEQLGARFVCRALVRFEKQSFAVQEAELRRMLDLLPIARLSIDSGGIGMNLAENLSRDYPQVIAETFTTQSKERWATDFKILLQHGNAELPLDRELLAEVHSIERHITQAGRPVFESTATKGHADRAWAIMLACQKERANSAALPEVQVIVVGERDAPRDPVTAGVEELRRYWSTPVDEADAARQAGYCAPAVAPLVTPREDGSRPLSKKQRRAAGRR